ncbi:hypothetical protein ACFU6I_11100 [Streptomyces sp. NPDC057486]
MEEVRDYLLTQLNPALRGPGMHGGAFQSWITSRTLSGPVNVTGKRGE